MISRDKISSPIEQAIANQIFPGCIIGITNGRETSIFPFGSQTYETDAQNLEKDTIFDVASVTKSIPTSSLAHTLLEQKQIKLTDKVAKYLPRFTGRYKDQITIWHLLTQTVDFGFSLSAQKDKTTEEITKQILSANLVTPPGSTYTYSNATSICLGWIVEQVFQDTLDNLGAKYLFNPLGMTKTTFHPHDRAKIAPTEIDPWRGKVIQGEVHDESAWRFFEQGKIVGSAGLFSTTPDLLTFLNMLLNRGVYDGKQIFTEYTVESFQQNQLAYMYQSASLGWELNQPHFMGKHSTTIVGKRGFTGCMVLCDLTKNIGLVMLSNATYPKRKDSKYIFEARRTLADTIFNQL